MAAPVAALPAAVEERLIHAVGAGVSAVLRAKEVASCTIQVQQHREVARLVFAAGEDPARVHYAVEVPGGEEVT